jgi:uncharacterized protein (TIGR02145 family)
MKSDDSVVGSLKMRKNKLRNIFKNRFGHFRAGWRLLICLGMVTLCLALSIFLLSFLSYSQSTEKETGTFSDPRDGQIYKWVKIGNQIWMAENLRFKTESGSWCWENEEKNCETKGRLYTWEEAMRAAPPGWHLPSDEEWKELEVSLGLTREQADQEGFRVDTDGLLAGKIKLKEAWPDKYEGIPIIITNETGFSAIIAGFYANDEFTHDGYASWWTCSGNDSHAWIRHIGFFDNTITRVLNRKEFAFSVRCVKDQNGAMEPGPRGITLERR